MLAHYIEIETNSHDFLYKVTFQKSIYTELKIVLQITTFFVLMVEQ